MSKRQLVQVTWVDSCSPKGWTNYDGFEDYGPDEITSVGWVIQNRPKSLTIAAHCGTHQVDGVMCIPRCAITSRKVIG